MLIPQHLFRPKPFPRAYIARDRLVRLMHSFDYAKVLVIEAPGGYGKSLAVAEFARHAPAQVAWYPLEFLADDNVLSFIQNLMTAIQTAVPEFGRRIQPLLEDLTREGSVLNREKKGVMATLLAALTTELAALSEPLTVVLENYQTITTQEIHETIVLLVEQSPDTVRFVVTSRVSPRWSARPRWEGQDLLATVSASDLAFTPAESHALAITLGLQLTPAQIDAIHASIRGWPILHHLLYTNCQSKRADEVAEVLLLLTLPNNAIHDYLAQELLARETPATNDFLCRTSLLRQLDPATCNAILGIANASDILDRLAESWFLTAVGGRQTKVYIHSHEIVRDFLQQVLQTQFGTGELQQLYFRLGQFLEAQDDWDQAITAYCEGKQFAEASRLIGQHTFFLVDTAQLSRLTGWLAHLPRSWREQDPTLLVCQGIIAANDKNPLAEEYLLRAQKLFEDIDDPSGAAWSNVELGWMHYLQRKNARAIEILQATLRLTAISDRLRARILHYLSMAYYGLDYFQDCLTYADKADEILRRLGTPADKASLVRLHRQTTAARLDMGQFQDAIRVLEGIRYLARDLQQSEWSLAWIDNQLAETYRRLGQFEEAHRYLNEAEALVAGFRSLNLQADLLDYLLITRGHIYRDTYDYERAEAFYRNANRGRPNGVFLGLRLVQPEQFQEAFDLAQRSWRKYVKDESPVRRAMYEALLGLAYLFRKDHKQALIYLEPSDATLEQYGAMFSLVTVRLYLAKTYLDLKQANQGLACLRHVMEYMARADYQNLDVWQPWIVAEMCAVALREDIAVDFVEHLAITRLTSDHAVLFLPLVNHPRQDVRNRAISILQSQGSQLGLRARELLNACKDDTTRNRLVSWLDSGWLKELGLISLAQLLSWRELETFVAWIYPPFDGSIERISNELRISVDTVNRHLQNSRRDLEDAGIVAFVGGKNVRMEAYGWAVRSQFIDPYAST